MTQAIYYQYLYNKGDSPVSAAIGNVPVGAGAESFEAAAVGDLDGDNTPSRFAIVGQVDLANEMRVATQVSVGDEFE
jgi:type IV pilus assembly protein PilA